MTRDEILSPLDRMLSALSGILAKADAHVTANGLKPEALLDFRLYPDMLPFTRQVQLSCDFCVRAAARLSGAEVPTIPDTETSFADLVARVAGARAFLAGVTPEAMEGCDAREITIRMRGQDVTMTGLAYRTGFAAPQIYFHATMAYAILRHNGVEIGKADFMAA